MVHIIKGLLLNKRTQQYRLMLAYMPNAAQFFTSMRFPIFVSYSKDSRNGKRYLGIVVRGLKAVYILYQPYPNNGSK